MADACLRVGAHYLDVTGEVAVFEALAARSAEARAAGVMLLPGAGFDVVPSDCLAAHLKRRLPSASKLVLGFMGLSKLSRIAGYFWPPLGEFALPFGFGEADAGGACGIIPGGNPCCICSGGGCCTEKLSAIIM